VQTQLDKYPPLCFFKAAQTLKATNGVPEPITKIQERGVHRSVAKGDGELDLIEGPVSRIVPLPQCGLAIGLLLESPRYRGKWAEMVTVASRNAHFGTAPAETYCRRGHQLASRRVLLLNCF
jgi:hypothetical protein